MHGRAANHPGNTAEPKPTCGNPPPEARVRLAAQCEKVSDTFTSTDYDSGCASVSDTGSAGARSRLHEGSATFAGVAAAWCSRVSDTASARRAGSAREGV